MEPTFKKKVDSFFSALKEDGSDCFNLKDLEAEIAEILAPGSFGPFKERVSIPVEPRVAEVDKNFSFVRRNEEYIPGLSIPQKGEREAKEVLSFLSPKPSTSSSSFRNTDIRYRNQGASRGFVRNVRPPHQSSHSSRPSSSHIDHQGSAQFPGSSQANDETGETSGYRRAERQEPRTSDGPFATHTPRGRDDGVRRNESYDRGRGEGGPRRFQAVHQYDNRGRGAEGGRNYENRGRGAEGGRLYENRGRGAEGGRKHENRGRGIEGGRYYDNRGRGAEGGRYYDNRGRGGFGNNASPSTSGFGRGDRGGRCDRGGRGGRGGVNRGKPRRRLVTQKTPEEEAEVLRRMLIRDAEEEKRIRIRAGLLPPDS